MKKMVQLLQKLVDLFRSGSTARMVVNLILLAPRLLKASRGNMAALLVILMAYIGWQLIPPESRPAIALFQTSSTILTPTDGNSPESPSPVEVLTGAEENVNSEAPFNQLE